MNVPSFALFVLHPHNQSRFRFALTGEEAIDGTRTIVVTYRERERPTMIRSPRGEDRPARGSAWIDWATGRVMKTILQVDAGEHWMTETEVTYGRDARLDAWEPLAMHERHRAGADEFIDGTATYTNFRRFETNARIVSPPKRAAGPRRTVVPR